MSDLKTFKDARDAARAAYIDNEQSQPFDEGNTRIYCGDSSLWITFSMAQLALLQYCEARKNV